MANSSASSWSSRKPSTRLAGCFTRTREAFAQLLDRCGLLLLANLLVLLLVRRSLEALPRQTSAEEVHEDVTKRLEVVSARLLCKTRRRPQLATDGPDSGERTQDGNRTVMTYHGPDVY